MQPLIEFDLANQAMPRKYAGVDGGVARLPYAHLRLRMCNILDRTNAPPHPDALASLSTHSARGRAVPPGGGGAPASRLPSLERMATTLSVGKHIRADMVRRVDVAPRLVDPMGIPRPVRTSTTTNDTGDTVLPSPGLRRRRLTSTAERPPVTPTAPCEAAGVSGTLLAAGCMSQGGDWEGHAEMSRGSARLRRKRNKAMEARAWGTIT